MKITAKEILAEEKPYRMRLIDPMDVANRDRAQKIALIKENVRDFVEDFMMEIDLPNTPQIRVGNIHGFEHTNDINKVCGYIMVQAEIRTLSGIRVRLDLPVPVSKGYFYVPSIMKMGYDLKIFGKDIVEEIIEDLETVRPELTNSPYNTSKNFVMMENIEKDLFSVPKGDLDGQMLGLNFY